MMSIKFLATAWLSLALLLYWVWLCDGIERGEPTWVHQCWARMIRPLRSAVAWAERRVRR